MDISTSVEGLLGLCCIAGSGKRDAADEPNCSDDCCEVVEGCTESVSVGDVGGDVVVTSSEVLDERVTCREGPC